MEELNNNPLNTPEQKSSGPIVGVVIIILVLIVGALYFWGAELNREQSLAPERITNGTDGIANALRSQSQSDDVNSIQDDLKNTDLDSLTDDLNNIDKELGQQIQ